MTIFKPVRCAALLLCLAVVACASAPPQRGPGGRGRLPGGDRGGPPREAGRADGRSLFISPAGEPFRGPDARQQWLRLVDPTASGRITPEALIADARRYFAVLDLNHDGAITGPEVTHYENTVVPEILIAGGPGLQGAARFGLLNDPQPIRSADFNLDYQVTLAEYERKAREIFTRLDLNKDGVLLVSELPPPPSADGGRRRGRPPSGNMHPGNGDGGPRGQRTRGAGEPEPF